MDQEQVKRADDLAGERGEHIKRHVHLSREEEEESEHMNKQECYQLHDKDSIFAEDLTVYTNFAPLTQVTDQIPMESGLIYPTSLRNAGLTTQRVGAAQGGGASVVG